MTETARTGAIMTIICSEGHSEHDEQAALARFSGLNIPTRKRAERAEGTYPYRNTTRSPNGAYRAEKARK